MSSMVLKAREFKQTVREGGIRGAFRKYGWKMVVGIGAYYLVRDITLYVLLPYFVLRNI